MSDSERSPVLCDFDGDVATLTLHRPDRHNMWTIDMENRYFDLLEAISADGDVRAVVVTGSGRSFCPGIDVALLADMSELAKFTDAARRSATLPLRVPKPIVAAINGACAGTGLVQAMMCDVRFAARGVKLTTGFARRGLTAEGAAAWMLERLVGHARALDLLLSDRVVLAEEAHAMGLVNFVVEPDELLDRALAYAKDLAQACSPSAMAAIKQQVYRDLERGVGEAQQDAARMLDDARAHPDFPEGVRSFVERRRPRFAPLSRDIREPA